MTRAIQIIQETVERIEQVRPGLRSRDLEAWIKLVAWEAYAVDHRIGRKAAGLQRPISANTLGILPEADATDRTTFVAYEVARDERGAPPEDWIRPGDQNAIRFYNYGPVTRQQWYTPAQCPLEPPVPDPPPAPDPLPPPEPVPTEDALVQMVVSLSLKVSALEQRVMDLGAHLGAWR